MKVREGRDLEAGYLKQMRMEKPGDPRLSVH